MKKLKVRFIPLEEPKPVTLADIPEGVACVCVCRQSSHSLWYKGVLIRNGGDACWVTETGKTAKERKYEDADCVRVLQRLDGQPIPNAESEPVPLNTLEPWPVWYELADSIGRAGRYISRHYAAASYVFGDGSCNEHCHDRAEYTVLPRPYRMVTEVEDES